jgi:hypothetical protein
VKKIIEKVRGAVFLAVNGVKTVNKLDSALTHISLPPIDRHILLSYSFSNEGLFHPSYEDWRVKRINKILELFDIDWFMGKRVLELGGGTVTSGPSWLVSGPMFSV